MVWAMAVPPPAAASGGSRTEDHVIDVVDGPAGDQHVAIDSTLYLPSGVDAGHPAPAIIGAHGFGQDKHALAADASFVARRGYAVLLYSARGFGNSTGRIGLDSPDYEVKDVHQLVDWLGARPEVRRGAARPPVGMFGACLRRGDGPDGGRLRPAHPGDRADRHVELARAEFSAERHLPLRPATRGLQAG